MARHCPAPMNRRTLLKMAAAAELGAVLAPSGSAQARPAPEWRTELVGVPRSASRARTADMPGTTWRAPT